MMKVKKGSGEEKTLQIEVDDSRQ